jgi:hypothetical protein
MDGSGQGTGECSGELVCAQCWIEGNKRPMNRKRSDTIRQAIELLVGDAKIEYAHQRAIELFTFYAWMLS